MNYVEFKKHLKNHRTSIKDFSQILNISYSGIQKWKNIGIPQYVSEYLDVLNRLSAEEREKYLREKLELNI
jgi:hypothetical protein